LADPQVLLALALAALLAGTLAAVTGFGGGVLLLPILVAAFGVHEAIPIFSVAQMIGNGARVWFNRRDLVLPVVGWFSLGAIPLTIVGGIAFAAAPSPIIRRLLGCFLLLTVAYRHTSLGRRGQVGLRGFAGLGALFGFLSALLGSVGPLMAPFFLSYGLMKAAFIGTEACATLVMHVVRLAVYGGLALIEQSTVALGLAIGAVLILGSYIGKRLLDWVPQRYFPILIELVLVVSGLQFLLFE
jgi:uncharacterized protein